MKVCPLPASGAQSQCVCLHLPNFTTLPRPPQFQFLLPRVPIPCGLSRGGPACQGLMALGSGHPVFLGGLGEASWLTGPLPGCLGREQRPRLGLQLRSQTWAAADLELFITPEPVD
jgi:hypothetical protein